MKLRDKIASSLGSIMEWYDFALYGYFGIVIAKLYFPGNAQIGILKVFSVFAVGFFARPFGALIFGYISDKYGRSKTLKLTPLLIALPTFLFSILPPFSQIGILAPIFLVVLRLWQGICIGGEYANNIIYLCETTSNKYRYFMGSLGSCSASIGILIASLAAGKTFDIFQNSNSLMWGWRISFALSLLLGTLTFFMRKNMQETPVFELSKANNSVLVNPLSTSFKLHWQTYLVAAGLTFMPATAFYFVFLFLPTYFSDLGYNHSIILAENSFSLLLRLFLIPTLGLAADKFGGLKLIRFSSILFLMLTYPLLYAVFSGAIQIGIVLYIFGLLTTLNAATLPGLLMNLIKPETRSTIVSFTLNLCFGVFGGVVTAVCFLIWHESHNKLSPAYYMIFASGVTLFTTFFLKEKSHDFKKLSSNIYQ